MTTAAYAAGLFDGEGCIQITRVGKAHGADKKYHRLSCSISSTNRQVLDWMMIHYGGRVGNHRRPTNPKWRPSWRWMIADAGAEEFLRTALPFLIIKHAEALVAIEFRAIRVPAEKVVGGRRGQSLHSVDEVFGQREMLRERLTVLKRPEAA